MYRKKYGMRTIAVIATRGEGGQNEIGPELYNDLGVIRTDEMMRASKVTGADLHFLDLPEFGFSKSPEETFAIWGREEAVKRLVRVIRKTQPTVIISNHGTQKDHGHHQAIGIALRDAFDASGDAARFPELAEEGLAPWQPARLYLRAWQSTPGAARVEINQIDEMRGKTYAQIAADALGEHQSQGMGFFINLYLSGTIVPAYTLEKTSDAFAPPLRLPSGEPVLLAGLPGNRAPERVRKPSPRVAIKQAARSAESGQAALWRIERAHRYAALSHGLHFTAKASDTEVVRGQPITVNATLTDYDKLDVESVDIALEGEPWFGELQHEPVSVALEQNRSATAKFQVLVPDVAPHTMPEGEHLFAPHFREPQFHVIARARIRGVATPIELRSPVSLRIAPRVSVKALNAPLLVRKGRDTQTVFDLLVTNHGQDAVEAKVAFSVAPGFVPEQTMLPVTLGKEGEQRIVPVKATIGDNLEPRDYLLNAVIDGDERPSFGVARLVDVKVPEDMRVGIVQSYDNTFANVLEKLGVAHELVNSEDFSAPRLDRFSAIVIDIRAYLVRPDLAANNAAILEYAARGGTVLVMYHKTEEWRSDFAPYPITLSRNRVTREDAPIKHLAPLHPIFNLPNRIVEADWKGWIQERGLYFPSEWDERYTPLISCADPGETIPPGAMLAAQHGNGHYVYTALVLYRQLRELHPGALRLFVNMLAL